MQNFDASHAIFRTGRDRDLGGEEWNEAEVRSMLTVLCGLNLLTEEIGLGLVHNGARGIFRKPRQLLQILLTDGGMVASAADGNVPARFVGHLHALNVQTPVISLIGTNYDFAQEGNLLRQL